MKRKIIIPMKSISNNSISQRDQRFKSDSFKDWMPKICAHLRKENNSKTLTDLRENFNFKKNYAIVKMTMYYPEEVFFTKGGWISKYTIDKSNDEKALLDILFNKDFRNKNKPLSAPNIESDDCYVADLISKKRPIRGDFLTEIEIEIKDIQELWLEKDN